MKTVELEDLLHMELHDTIYVNATEADSEIEGVLLTIIRVPGGWLYNGTFVPLSNFL